MELQLPTCALIGNRGTVILRLRDNMEECKGCHRSDSAYRRQCSYQPLDNVCELCTRTRYNCICDCDSAPYERWRTCQSSRNKSRYLKVCAAVCLLLLACSTPGASAAAIQVSRGIRTMEQDPFKSREYLWENPCDVSLSDIPVDTKPQTTNTYLPKDLSQHAARALDRIAEHKNLLAKLQSFQNYKDMIEKWQTYDWIRELPWYADNSDVLPKEKPFEGLLDETIVIQIVDDKNRLSKALPAMLKTMKLLVVGYDYFEQDNVLAGTRWDALREKVKWSKHEIRQVLCEFSNLVSAYGVPDADSQFTEEEKSTFLNLIMPVNHASVSLVLLYRDSLELLQYLQQVAGNMPETL